MSKGIIVVDDIPKSCEECRFSVFYECGIGFCKAKREHIDSDEPDWCPIKPAKQWIPVEERLPETNDYILLSFANFSLPAVGRYEADQEGGAFYLGDCDEGDTCVSQDLFVNAWMPLPEPYRPEGGETHGNQDHKEIAGQIL